MGDFRGPYGVIVRLPCDTGDEVWAEYAGTRSDTDLDSAPGSSGGLEVGRVQGSVDQWAHAGVAMRAVRAHAASLDQDRGYTVDGVWWIVDDTS